WPPIDFAVSGQPYGYAIDTLALVAAMTGLRLDFVNGLSWPELVALFEGGQLDILQPVFGTAENSARGRLSLPFLRVPYGVITPPGAAPVSHIGQLDGKRVAIPRGWSILPIVRNHYPHIQVVEANSVRDMFAAVRGGRADAGLDTAAILDYTMRQFFIADLTLHQRLAMGDTPLPEDLHLLLPRDAAALAEIIDLALANITPAQRQALASKWLGNPAQAVGDNGAVPHRELVTLAADPGGHGG